MQNSRLPGQHQWAVGYVGNLYTSQSSDPTELDLISWYLGNQTVRSSVRDSECTSDTIESGGFEVTCQLNNVTSQLVSTLIVRDELTSGDDGKVVRFEAEGMTDDFGKKEKSYVEVAITVKGIELFNTTLQNT